MPRVDKRQIANRKAENTCAFAIDSLALIRASREMSCAAPFDLLSPGSNEAIERLR
jgi:hypothetical protein